MATIPDRIALWKPQAAAAGSIFGVDPLDILALVARESNGDPNAQSPDGGLGLMQVTRKYHPTFCDALGPDGRPLWRHPGWNIMYGTSLFRFNLDLFDGMDFDARLPAFAAFNASVRRVRGALRELSRPTTEEQVTQVLDPLTTGGNYVSDVLKRRASYVLLP